MISLVNVDFATLCIVDLERVVAENIAYYGELRLPALLIAGSFGSRELIQCSVIVVMYCPKGQIKWLENISCLSNLSTIYSYLYST